MIGLLIVGLGTSFPELIASIVMTVITEYVLLNATISFYAWLLRS
jgi:Ca2+/Na+ antiporter